MMPATRPRLPGRLAAAVLLAAACVAPPVLADGRSDHEDARSAVARGQALPLEPLLAQAERLTGGRSIDVDFEHEHGRLVYELELLLPDGRVIELEIDARTGEWLKLEGARLERLFARGARVAPVAPAASAAPMKGPAR